MRHSWALNWTVVISCVCSIRLLNEKPPTISLNRYNDAMYDLLMVAIMLLSRSNVFDSNGRLTKCSDITLHFPRRCYSLRILRFVNEDPWLELVEFYNIESMNNN
jgi:hypothetical protein